ncbi:hypothetical protein GGI12_002688 [Dipsacomyces acuminosporus]|nr:hypothetical protein GGI12_002688 [Dipsacomyces acuminosporus]
MLVSADMVLDSFTGPVTQNEISSFKSHIDTLQPANTVAGNEWAQGKSGETVKALGLMYEISKDTAILNKMITYCDKVLSLRNDLTGSGCAIWTGGVDPVWVTCGSTGPIATGGEQGDPVGHLGNCARLILSTPDVWFQSVPDNNPFGYGSTYLDRAITYVKQGDVSIDGHILKSELTITNAGQQYFNASNPYKGGTGVPWNQQMMFNYAFDNMATAHALLCDNPNKVSSYNSLVQASISWFDQLVKKYTDGKGNPAYNWGYDPAHATGEDSNHGSLDTAGFSRHYATGKYNLSTSFMTPFANTLADVMILNSTTVSGRVDGSTGTGHGSSTSYIRSGYLLMAEFRPSDVAAILGFDLTPGKPTTSIDQFSRAMWVKYRLSK